MKLLSAAVLVVLELILMLEYSESQVGIQLIPERHPGWGWWRRDICADFMSVGDGVRQYVRLHLGQTKLLRNCVEAKCEKFNGRLQFGLTGKVSRAIFDEKFCEVDNLERTVFPTCDHPHVKCVEGYKGSVSRIL